MAILFQGSSKNFVTTQLDVLFLVNAKDFFHQKKIKVPPLHYHNDNDVIVRSH